MDENFSRHIFYYENHYLDFFEKLRPEQKEIQLDITTNRNG